MSPKTKKLMAEPSTWGGVAAMLAAGGVLGLTEELWQQVLAGIGVVLGALAASVLDPADREKE